MQFWVYILRCSDGSYYTGHTDALEQRLAQHREGLGSDWTRSRRPIELVWCSDAPTREEALAFERRVKNWSRVKKEAMMAGDWARVGHFARPPSERPSTSLGTNESSDLHQPELPEAQESFVPSEVEVRRPAAEKRPSTSLGTNEPRDLHQSELPEAPTSFVPSEGFPERSRRVEARGSTGQAKY
jgi:predicted GIY-YIG superfamily endonuclease